MHTVKLNIQDSAYNHVMYLLKSLNSKDIEVIEDDNMVNDKQDAIRKSTGILTGKNIDPLKWQDDIRSEWDERETLLNRL